VEVPQTLEQDDGRDEDAEAVGRERGPVLPDGGRAVDGQRWVTKGVVIEVGGEDVREGTWREAAGRPLHRARSRGRRRCWG
jgi:hypothetical protein